MISSGDDAVSERGVGTQGLRLFCPQFPSYADSLDTKRWLRYLEPLHIYDATENASGIIARTMPARYGFERCA